MKKMILVDGNSLMYRAYYATAATGNLMKNSKGLYTNAIYAFVNMISSLLKEKFDYFLVAFDAGKKTFRHEILQDYKGGRSPMPDEMRVQIPYLKKYLDIVGIKRYEMDLYEADDIIGTMAKIAKENNIFVDIYSSDKDLLQLVDNNVTVNLCKKGIHDLDKMDKEAIINKYGLTNTQMIDFKALMGDPSDNLKGIPGVGEKTAIKLLQEYQTLENMIEKIDTIKGKLKEKIKDGYNDALICKKMVTINQDSPIDLSLDDTLYNGFDNECLREFFVELEFHSFAKKMKMNDSNFIYKTVDSPALIDDYLIPNSFLVAELDNYNYHKGNIIGFGLSNDLGNFYIPLDMLYQSISFQMYLSEENNKIVFGLKKMVVALKKLGIELKGVSFDALLGSYVLNPSIGKEDIKIISQNYGYDDLDYDENIYGKGVKFMIPNDDSYKEHIAKKAFAVKNIYKTIKEKLLEYNQYSLLVDCEMPLAYVLASIELEGMKVDRIELERQKEYLKKLIFETENKIYELAGYKFNVASTKQLAELLFEKLNLPSGKKTKTGYSTDSSVLEEIKDLHPIVEMILNYRAYSKLLSTYVDGIENSLYENDMVHTIFEQALTQTGRLSSIEPNLQNIPVRTSLGKETRKMFVPKYDILLSADYSQIELRVLAHMANVKPLIEAFNNGEDIHAKTASQVFGITDVTPEYRRRAKAINFGIIYGISPWGLANDLHISQSMAKDIINKYLETYPEINIFMDNAKKDAVELGYVLTILNRRRYINEAKSSNFYLREFGKRTAMNAPIQGSAADIIKLAMIAIYQEFEQKKLKSKMICQVHDELIFDCVIEEKDIVIEIVKRNMENIIDMLVPLEIDYGFGKNWFEVK